MNRSNSRQSHRLYRSRTNSVFMGVCGGLAEYFDFSPWGMRALAFLLIFFSGIFPGVIIYVVLGMMMKHPPERNFGSVEEEDFWYTVQGSPSAALRRIQRRFEMLDKRLQRMETIVTSSEFELQEEYRRL